VLTLSCRAVPDSALRRNTASIRAGVTGARPIRTLRPSKRVSGSAARSSRAARRAQLIGFGLSLFAKSTNTARLNLLVKGLPGLAVMLAGLVRTIGYQPKGLPKPRR